jgi:hypothetical protein
MSRHGSLQPVQSVAGLAAALLRNAHRRFDITQITAPRPARDRLTRKPPQTLPIMKLALALTAGTAAAFVAPSAPAAKTQLAAAPVQEWAGATAPFGFFDPLGLSKDVDAGRLA